MNQVCIALDLETTGVNAEEDEIIEVAVVKFRGERTLEKWQTLVNPHCPVPYRTQRLTGITQAEVDAAPTLAEVAGRLVSFVKDSPIVGQSVPHDLEFLARKGLVLSNLVYDTFDLASILLPELTDYSLSAVASHLRVPYSVQHRALADAMASKDVFLALWRKAMGLNVTIVGEINRLLAPVDSPLRQFFLEVERSKSRDAFSTSIGAQLATKLGLEELNQDFLTRGARRDRALTPRLDRQPIDVEQAASLLGPDGPLARTLPGFEHRPEQVRMLRAVAEAFNQGKNLLVEAGTGTGKSLAYLLPALLFSLQNEARVIISTNTINLQEQLVTKDIPDLQAVLAGKELDRVPELVPSGDQTTPQGGLSAVRGQSWRAALVKGRSNYICLRQWGLLQREESLSLDAIKVLIRILVWLPTTTTGDRSELNLGPGEAAIWPRICAQVDTCTGPNCPFYKRGTCFFYRARWQAEGAHLVVVNHALLLSDLMANSKVLPDYDYLIVDEAHHLEEEATRQLAFEVSEHVVQDYLARLADPEGVGRRDFLGELRTQLRAGQLPPPAQREIDEAIARVYAEVDAARERVHELFHTLGGVLRERAPESGDYDRRLRLTHAVRAQAGWSEVEMVAENLWLALKTVGDSLGRIYAALEGLGDARIPEFEGLLAELGALAQRAMELGRQTTAVVAGSEENYVYWTSLDPQSGRAALCAAPLHVGPLLEQSLFSPRQATILTSATLSTRGNFDYVKGQLGMADADELIVGSPFDYRRAALVLVVEDIPEPNRPGYQRAVEQILTDLCRATGGRTLALFTSRRSVRATHSAIQPILQREEILVLGHGLDGSRKQLLSTFKSNPRTVLLGTSSFWEGIDVVGDALSALVIAKLPFSVPTDPVFAARSELFEDPFHEYAIPQAVLKFKQGFGRLIRSRSDRGVVVILDRRVQSKGYGAAFRQSLPDCTVKTCLSRQVAGQALAWLKAKPIGGER